MDRPIIALTMGDAAGIGPEIVLKTLADPRLYARCRPLVLGDPEVFAVAAQRFELALTVREVVSPDEAYYTAGTVDVFRPEGLGSLSVVPGRVDAAMGQAAATCMREAYTLAAVGRVHGVVLAPMSKEAFHKAGYHHSDELDYLKELTDSPEAYSLGMMGRMWATRVTEHVAFREIPDLITRERVLWFIRQLHGLLVRLGNATPRIAVAGLNVHAGEGGSFGREEIDVIAPAIGDARVEGLDVTGPVPADTVFVRALGGEFDGVVGMYHDQVNIARKLQPMGDRATVYVGLPVPCATTAHGTAFDIAGQGLADPSGFLAALDCVIRLAKQETLRHPEE